LNTQFLAEPKKTSAPVNEWRAFLRLNFAKTKRGVRLVEKEHHGPLYVQKPFYPEGAHCPHIYLLHPPGGLVSGDRLEITVNAAEQANVLVTTPGAGRMYRARADGLPQTQVVNLNVAKNASVEWLPLETIVFPKANAESCINIELAENSKFIYWDTLCLGLHASNEPFDQGQYSQLLQVKHHGKLKLQERLTINDDNRTRIASMVGMRGHVNQGLLLAGGFTQAPLALIDKIRQRCETSSLLAAVTFIEGILIVRSLANCSEQSRTLFEQIWGEIRPELLDRTACPPRIWNT
jgi:urease accessory protein